MSYVLEIGSSKLARMCAYGIGNHINHMVDSYRICLVKANGKVGDIFYPIFIVFFFFVVFRQLDT